MVNSQGEADQSADRDVRSGDMIFQPILEKGVFRFDCSADDRASSFPSVSFVNAKDREAPIADVAQAVPSFIPTFQCRSGNQTVQLQLPDGTSFYGSGEVSGKLERTGKRVFTWNTDAWGYGPGTTSLYQSHPWVLAVLPNGEAIGLLADTTKRCEIDLRAESVVKFLAASSYPIISFGPFPSPTTVLKTLSHAIGTVFMPPKWSLGYHQCRWSYDSDQRVREVAKTFREKGIPCDVIWMDIDYMQGFRCFTFDQGDKIQGETHTSFAEEVRSCIVVGSVYNLSGYGLRNPRSTYGTSRGPHWLSLTPLTKFELLPETDPPFMLDSFCFFEFEDLDREIPSKEYLTDVIGKIVDIGKPDHFGRADSGSSVVPVQTFTIVNERGFEIKASLWGHLSKQIDPAAADLDDSQNPMVVAFASFVIGRFRGNLTAKSCTASRVVVRPQHPKADLLRTVFLAAPRPILSTVPKFESPEKWRQHLADSVRTIAELDSLLLGGCHVNSRFRCAATISGIDSTKKWWYRSCTQCSKSVHEENGILWCRDHLAVPASQTLIRYRLKLFVFDKTSQGEFVLLGHSADKILPIPAAELVQAYPEPNASLPPPLTFMVGQTVTFTVQIPLLTPSNPFSDFRVTAISNLAVPASRLKSQMPKTPAASASSHTHGWTPMPMEPEFNRPLSPSVPTIEYPFSYPVPGEEHHHAGLTASSPPLKPSSRGQEKINSRSATPPRPSSAKASRIRRTNVSATAAISGAPASHVVDPSELGSANSIALQAPPDVDDDVPLVSLLASRSNKLGKKRKQWPNSAHSPSQPTLQPMISPAVALHTAVPHPCVVQAKLTTGLLAKEIADFDPDHGPPSVNASPILLKSPLAKVKLEKLAPVGSAFSPPTPDIKGVSKKEYSRSARSSAKKELCP